MDIKRPAWENFLESVNFDSDESNFKYEFNVMTKKYGQAFIAYCKAAWEVNDGVQTAEEFCKMNANMPISFFEKAVLGKK